MMWFKKFVHDHTALSGFTAAYLLGSVVAIGATGDTEFAFYLVSLLLIVALVLLIHRRVQFSSAVLWSLSIWGLAHMVGGLVPAPPRWPYHGDSPVMYSVWIVEGFLKYDHVVHAFGFGTCVFVCQQVMQSLQGEGRDQAAGTRFLGFGWLLLCILAASGLGAMNEIIEFAATRVSPETNVGGYVNTALDLVANLVGAVVAAVLIFVRHRNVEDEVVRPRDLPGELSS